MEEVITEHEKSVIDTDANRFASKLMGLDEPFDNEPFEVAVRALALTLILSENHETEKFQTLLGAVNVFTEKYKDLLLQLVPKIAEMLEDALNDLSRPVTNLDTNLSVHFCARKLVQDTESLLNVAKSLSIIS